MTELPRPGREPAGDIPVGVRLAEEDEVGAVLLDQLGERGGNGCGGEGVPGVDVEHTRGAVGADGGESFVGAGAQVYRRDLVAELRSLGQQLEPKRARSTIGFLDESPDG